MQAYREVRKLGQGQYGEVFEVIRKSDGVRMVIKKTLGASPSIHEAAKQEAALLKQVHHPNVVEFYDMFVDGGQFCIVTELATGNPHDLAGLIAQHPEGLPQDDVIEVARQLASALSHAHHRDIIHRDVKPANVLRMANGTIRLGDFGVGRMGDGETQVGTPLYMPPEMFSKRKYSKAVDVWAMGCVLFEMLTGKPPFENIAQICLLKEPPAVPPEKCGARFAQLLTAMLAVDPAKRPSAHQVYVAPAVGRLPLVVWWDPNVFNDQNRQVLAHHRADPNIQGVELIACETREDALAVVQGAPSPDLVYVVTNRGQGEAGPRFHEECRRLGVRNRGLVWCTHAQGIPPELCRPAEIVVDVRKLAVADYIWHVPLGNR